MNFKVWTIALAALGTTVPCVAWAAGDDDSSAPSAPAYTIEDVTACSADAMRLCRDKLPKLDEIEACMKAHYSQLRPKCQKRF